ncbi:MAG: hypothetical protein QM613_03180 [Micrococcaceae bacterium]
MRENKEHSSFKKTLAIIASVLVILGIAIYSFMKPDFKHAKIDDFTGDKTPSASANPTTTVVADTETSAPVKTVPNEPNPESEEGGDPGAKGLIKYREGRDNYSAEYVKTWHADYSNKGGWEQWAKDVKKWRDPKAAPLTQENYQFTKKVKPEDIDVQLAELIGGKVRYAVYFNGDYSKSAETLVMSFPKNNKRTGTDAWKNMYGTITNKQLPTDNEWYKENKLGVEYTFKCTSSNGKKTTLKGKVSETKPYTWDLDNGNSIADGYFSKNCKKVK